MMTRTLSVCCALALAPSMACSKSEPSGGGTGQQPNAGIPQASKDLFAQRCATCHGVGGHGDGPAALSMTPHPRDFTDKVWQGGAMDDQLAKTIVRGGAAVGKSPLMTANLDLVDKPDVVAGLVQIVRNFGK